MFGLLLLLAGAVPHEEWEVNDTADLVELNHFFDDQGRHVFDQFIFYNWDSWTNRFQVKAWRLVKNDGWRKCPIEKKNWEWKESLKPENERLPYNGTYSGSPQGPHYDHKNRYYYCYVYEGDLFIKVKCHFCRDSWTQYDPELVEREFLPKEHRIDLIKPMTLEARRAEKEKNAIPPANNPERHGRRGF